MLRNIITSNSAQSDADTMKLELYQNLLLQSLKCWQKRATRNGNWYTANTLSITDKNSHYLHHQQDGVEDNEGHDEVLEGRRLDKSPQLILVTIAFLSGRERSRFSLVGGLVSRESCALLCKPL